MDQANIFDELQYQLFAFVINLMAAILLLRTFTGKERSRYLIHIAIAFAIVSFFPPSFSWVSNNTKLGSVIAAKADGISYRQD